MIPQLINAVDAYNILFFGCCFVVALQVTETKVRFDLTFILIWDYPHLRIKVLSIDPLRILAQINVCISIYKGSTLSVEENETLLHHYEIITSLMKAVHLQGIGHLWAEMMKSDRYVHIDISMGHMVSIERSKEHIR